MPISIVIQNEGAGLVIAILTTNLFGVPVGPDEDPRFVVLGSGEQTQLTVDDGKSILIKEQSPHPGGYSEPEPGSK